MFRAKISIWWVSRDLAELGHLVFISGKWEMRAQTREREQVPSALHQKFRLKINIAAYGRAVGLLVALGLLNPKPLIPHLKWDHHLKGNKISYISMYTLSMLSKRFGLQIELKRIFSPVFGAALHSGVRQLMMSRTLAHAIHTHSKLRRGAKMTQN